MPSKLPCGPRLLPSAPAGLAERCWPLAGHVGPRLGHRPPAFAPSGPGLFQDGFRPLDVGLQLGRVDLHKQLTGLDMITNIHIQLLDNTRMLANRSIVTPA